MAFFFFFKLSLLLPSFISILLNYWDFFVTYWSFILSYLWKEEFGICSLIILFIFPISLFKFHLVDLSNANRNEFKMSVFHLIPLSFHCVVSSYVMLFSLYMCTGVCLFIIGYILVFFERSKCFTFEYYLQFLKIIFIISLNRFIAVTYNL